MDKRLFLLLAAALLLWRPVLSQTDCTAGHTERSDFYADIIQTRIYYTVYLPPCYDQTTSDYPVIYLMHGSNDDDGQWGRMGLYDVLDAGIQAGTVPPVIAVMPFGEWVANENRFDAASWGAVFRDELMPLVEDQYRIDTQQESRAIGGVSRGGFWAFQIALTNPELFSVVGGHSGFFDLYHAEPEDNPLYLVLDAPNIEHMRFAIDRGADDYAAPGLDIMGERLAERGLNHTYTIYPEGQHWITYWSSHVESYVDFYVADWESAPETPETVEQDIVTPSGASPLWSATATPRPTGAGEATPEATVDAATDDTAGYDLFVPVVAFPSFQLANLTGEQLGAIRAGLVDERLVLSESTAAALREHGVTVSESARIVGDGALYDTLWRDRTRFTLLPFDQLTPRYRLLRVDETLPLDVADYPFAFESETPNYQPDKLTRLALSGVTALTRSMIPVLDANGVEWAASGIREYVQAADVFHTSNEVSFTPGCPAAGAVMLGGSSSFCSKAAHFELFTELGLDIVELSGNHNNDYGYDAYLETLNWYQERGIHTLGGGEDEDAARTPLILSHNDNSVAMLSCNWVGPYYALANDDPTLLGGVRPGAAECNLDWLRETLPGLDAEHDLVVVTVQYLEMDQFFPTESQQIDFRTLVDLGADVVVGTSSHFPQTFEFRAGDDGSEALIHYGLGNLYFDQTFFGGVRFFIDQLLIYEGRLLGVDLFTGIIEDQGRPRPMTPDERENFLFLIFNEHGSF